MKSSTGFRTMLWLITGTVLSGCGGGGGGGGSSGSGQSPPSVPSLSVSEVSLSFTSTDMSTPTATQAVTVRNAGSGPLSITNVAIAGPNAAAFAESNTCSGTLSVNGTCVVKISFTPTISGSLTASLQFTSNAASNPSVALSGNAEGWS
jgi:hypothetical protein